MSVRRPVETYLLGAISFWVVILVGTPIALWVFGDAALKICILAGVLSQTFAVCVALFQVHGAKSLVLYIFPILLLAWIVEYIGSNTGFPFGDYKYTEILQPQLGGVPLIIPMAWIMMLPPAWGAAFAIVREPGNGYSVRVRIARAGIAATAFTAWDLFLDPQMVQWGFWKWSVQGIYYGIPLLNYLGWLLVSFILSILLMPKTIDTLALFIIYAITWVLQTIGLFFFWKLPGPAMFGFAGMGCVVLLAVMTRKK